MVHFDGQRDDVDQFGRYEWLVTNGIGGYACGTVAGMLSRHYHGLLIASLKPPLERTLTVAKVNEYLVYRQKMLSLTVDEDENGLIGAENLDHLKRFHLEGTIPVWTYAFDDAELEKRIWMAQGESTTYVLYSLTKATKPLELTLELMVNYRGYHETTRAEDNAPEIKVEQTANGLQMTPKGGTPFYVIGADVEPQQVWVKGYYKATEAYRGEPAVEDHLYVGDVGVTLYRGQSFAMIASTNADANPDVTTALERRRKYERELVDMAHVADDPPEIYHLVRAADQFIVHRVTVDEPHGRSVLAGFPWFTDWGRDTMIALPGLTLATRRPEIAERVLRTFARYVDQGMLPNRFPDAGEHPSYNTADATLWYFEAIRAYHAYTGDDALLRDLVPVLQDIVRCHINGTRYGIGIDRRDGLLCAGEAGVQLTWMDVKSDDRVVTPRTGKAVEINALWYNALCCMVAFITRLGGDAAPYNRVAQRVKEGFDRFWNGRYYTDVIDGPDGDDDTLRPNQVIALSLHHSPIDDRDRQKAVLDLCQRHLLTPYGLRSLAPHYADYVPVYGGDRLTRDAAYHQGTVWGWLMGPYVAAHLRVYDDKARARELLQPLLTHINTHGLGTISEIFDADPPHTPRGCFAQAWSVAEVLRAWRLTAEHPLGDDLPD